MINAKQLWSHPPLQGKPRYQILCWCYADHVERVINALETLWNDLTGHRLWKLHPPNHQEKSNYRKICLWVCTCLDNHNRAHMWHGPLQTHLHDNVSLTSFHDYCETCAKILPLWRISCFLSSFVKYQRNTSDYSESYSYSAGYLWCSVCQCLLGAGGGGGLAPATAPQLIGRSSHAQIHFCIRYQCFMRCCFFL